MKNRQTVHNESIIVIIIIIIIIIIIKISAVLIRLLATFRCFMEVLSEFASCAQVFQLCKCGAEVLLMLPALWVCKDNKMNVSKFDQFHFKDPEFFQSA